jgi:hypothetical protein
VSALDLNSGISPCLSRLYSRIRRNGEPQPPRGEVFVGMRVQGSLGLAKAIFYPPTPPRYRARPTNGSDRPSAASDDLTLFVMPRYGLRGKLYRVNAVCPNQVQVHSQ